MCASEFECGDACVVRADICVHFWNGGRQHVGAYLRAEVKEDFAYTSSDLILVPFVWARM